MFRVRSFVVLVLFSTDFDEETKHEPNYNKNKQKKKVSLIEDSMIIMCYVFSFYSVLVIGIIFTWDY